MSEGEGDFAQHLPQETPAMSRLTIERTPTYGPEWWRNEVIVYNLRGSWRQSSNNTQTIRIIPDAGKACTTGLRKGGRKRAACQYLARRRLLSTPSPTSRDWQLLEIHMGIQRNNLHKLFNINAKLKQPLLPRMYCSRPLDNVEQIIFLRIWRWERPHRRME